MHRFKDCSSSLRERQVPRRRAQPIWRGRDCLRSIFHWPHHGAPGIPASVELASSATQGVAYTIIIPAVEPRDARVLCSLKDPTGDSRGSAVELKHRLRKHEHLSEVQTATAAAAAMADKESGLDHTLEDGVREQGPLDENASRLQALRAQLLELRLDLANMGRALEEREEELLSIKFDMVEQQLHIANMGRGLEEKEQDILSIQFELVGLQSCLRDQVNLACGRANAVEMTPQEQADRSRNAEVMEALLSQAKTLSEQLQAKVQGLGQELQRSQESYQALEREHQASAARHESERRRWMAELEQVRAKAPAFPGIVNTHFETA